ncbi:MAG: LptF/LptG family permease [Bacteroidetes bacterium]|nr:LptF/LptG family permease [Bacteroidota bacterium]
MKSPTVLKRMDLLVLRAYIGPFMVTFVLSMFLFLMQFLWKYIDELVGKGIEPLILAKLIFYSLADLIPMALPLTIMVAGLMTFGNLSETFELVALKANGISLGRIMRPILVLMTGLALLNFMFMNWIIPKANLEAKALLWDLRQKKPAFNIQEGVFYQQIDGFAIRIGKKEKDNESIKDIAIYEYKKDDSKRLNVIRAEKGKMVLSQDKRILYFTLENGVRYDEMTNSPEYQRTAPFNKMHFERQRMMIDLSSLDLKFTERDAYKGDYRLMNIRELNQEIDSSRIQKEKLEKEHSGFMGRYLHLPGLYPAPKNALTTRLKDSIFKPLDKADIAANFEGNYNGSLYGWAINNARGIKGTVDGFISNTKFEDDEIAPYVGEWHKKFTYSAIIILLFLISAPLGAIIRKGGIGMPLVISVVMFVLFYAVNLVGEKIGKEGMVPIWAGMWLSSMVLLPIGLYISYKAGKDSAVLSLEIYQKAFNKILEWVRLKDRVEESATAQKFLAGLGRMRKKRSDP